jgi:hypothetical protein
MTNIDIIGIIPQIIFKYLNRMGTWLVFINAILCLIFTSTEDDLEKDYLSFSVYIYFILYFFCKK